MIKSRFTWMGRFVGVTALALILTGQIYASASSDWKDIEKLILEYAEKDGKPSAEIQGQLNLLKFRLESFVVNHPDDKRAWNAKALLPEIGIQAARSLGFPADWSQAASELEGVLRDPALPMKQRADVEYAWISLSRARGDQATLTNAQWAELLERMEKFGDENPRHRAAASVHLAVGQLLAAKDAARAKRVLASAVKKGDPKTASEAERELAVLPYRQTPLDIQFTAVDGREVSVAALKGKVVLVDFWATWCGPCVRELPKVMAAYHEYRDRGFEIIGISLDDSRSDLEKFTAQRNMVWPQYFDGLGWDNKISRRFAILSIPTMWLLDQEGRVIATDVWGGNLDYYLKQLLAK